MSGTRINGPDAYSSTTLGFGPLCRRLHTLEAALHHDIERLNQGHCDHIDLVLLP
jgi:hypothetical protein